MPHNTIINIEELAAEGYYVEDLGVAFPRSCSGEYRWINRRTGDMQHHNVRTFSEYDAWRDAHTHASANRTATA